MNEDIIISKTKIKNAEMADRIDHIITLLAKGLKRAQILADPTVASWRMTSGSIDNYMRKAKGDIVENSQQARTEHLGRAVMNLDYLYTMALDCIDDDDVDTIPAIRIALDIQKEKNRLLTLSKVYDPIGADIPEELVPEAVHKMLDEITIVNSPTIREKDLDAEFGKKLIAGSGV